MEATHGKTIVYAQVRKESVVNPEMGGPDTSAYERLLKEAVFNFRAWGIEHYEDANTGFLAFKTDTERAQQTVRDLEHWTALNGEKVWKVTVAADFTESDTPEQTGPHAISPASFCAAA